MLIMMSNEEGPPPVTVMSLHGDLDSSSYRDVIERAQAAYDGGARKLVLDLAKVPYMSSAGLMAVHSVALIFGGQAVQPGPTGRPAFRALDPQLDHQARLHVRLVGPQPRVAQVLETVGLKQFFEIFEDAEAAVASFQPAA
jgi:anti-anti-sigma regulatory factor